MSPRPSRRLLIGALPDDLLLAEVAYHLAVTKQTVDNWRRGLGVGSAGPLPAYRCPHTGRWLVPTDGLRRWLGLLPGEGL